MLPSVTELKYFFRVYFRYLRLSLSGFMEYRADFIITVGVRLFQNLLSLVATIWLFTRISAIGNWTAPQVILISLIFNFSTSLCSFLFRPGFRLLSQDLNRGQADKYLVKPMDLQAYMLLLGLDWPQLVALSFNFAAIIWVFIHFHLQLTLLSACWGIMAVILFQFAYLWTISLILFRILSAGRINNIAHLASVIWEFGKLPTDIFSFPLSLFFTILIPVAFSGTIPAALILGLYSPVYLLLGIVVCLGLYTLSRYSLVAGLRRYSGAGG